MLREWLRGSSSSSSTSPDGEKAAEAKPVTRMVVEAEKPLETLEDARRRRREAYEAKLAESAKEGLSPPNNMLTYDTLFRKAQSLLLEGSMNEQQDGIAVNIARSVHNTMLTSKWVLAGPQTSNWEVTAQMNGFNDIIAASWSTLNRYQLLYQRLPSTGAIFVAQLMAQKQQGMLQGNLFTMLQYPWFFGGCTQAQYIKDQSFSLSHVQRIVRGLHIGSNLNVNPTTRASTLSHAVALTTPSKDAALMAEVTPANGTWRLVATAYDWAQSMDAAMELEYKEGQEGMTSSLNFGCRKSFVGGAELTAAVAGFNVLRANLTLPFGCETAGINQLRVQLGCQYEMHSGKLKQGISIIA